MSNYGVFSNNPQTEWVTDPAGEDRDMILLREFWYEDPQGSRWTAPQGSRINGASIPRPLWSTVGSPYTDDYRNASIVHDVACDKATTSDERKAADKMFYYACLAGGCSKPEAKMLYLGVRMGAWGSGIGGFIPRLSRRSLLYKLPTEPRVSEETMVLKTFSRIHDKIQRLDESADFEELEKLVDDELK